MNSLSQCSLAARSDSSLYTFNHLCSSGVTSYPSPRWSSQEWIPISPNPSLRFFSRTLYTFSYGKSARNVPHTRNLVARVTTDLNSSKLVMLLILIEPRLPTVGSSSIDKITIRSGCSILQRFRQFIFVRFNDIRGNFIKPFILRCFSKI